MSCVYRPPFQLHDAEGKVQLEKLYSELDREQKQSMQEAIKKGDTLSEGSEWMHKSSGKLYKIVCVTNLMASNPDFQPQVVYEDEDFSIWSRTLSEWESKFKYMRPAG